MGVFRIISFVAITALLFSLSLKSAPEDLEDTFVRLAIQHRGNFTDLKKEDRRGVLIFCNAAHNKVRDQLIPASEQFPLIIQGLAEHAPNGQILRICINLPKTLNSISAGLTPELAFWKDRLKFLTIERTNLDLAHLSIQLDDEGRPSITEAFLSDLGALKNQLKSLINFMKDLNQAFAGGVNNNTQAYDDDIRIFSIELVTLRRSDDHVIEPQLIDKMRNRQLAISGTLKFNDKIISFCRGYGEALSALDIVFDHLKLRYINLIKILEEIDPSRKKSKHMKFFKHTEGFVGFQKIAQDILEKYGPLNEDLSRKQTRIERQLTLHHLLTLQINARRNSILPPEFLPPPRQALRSRAHKTESSSSNSSPKNSSEEKAKAQS